MFIRIIMIIMILISNNCDNNYVIFLIRKTMTMMKKMKVIITIKIECNNNDQVIVLVKYIQMAPE